MKTKAMVSKVNADQGNMVVLTEDRQFVCLDLPRDIPALGSTIEVDITTDITFQRNNSSYRKLTWAATAAVLLLAFTLSIFAGNVPSAAAYVNLDMKSGLQLVVDNKGKVKEASAADGDGEKLLEELSLENKDVYQAVKDIVGKASVSGYFDGENENLVMASITKLNDSEDVHIDANKIRDIIYGELSSRHYPGYIVINEADKQYWEQAAQKGYTVNQSVMMERARQHGLDIEGEELGHNFIQAVRRSDVSIPALFPQESCEVTWENMVTDKEHSVSGRANGNTSSPTGSKDDNEMHHGGSPSHQQSPAGEADDILKGTVPEIRNHMNQTPYTDEKSSDWHESPYGSHNSMEGENVETHAEYREQGHM